MFKVSRKLSLSRRHRKSIRKEGSRSSVSKKKLKSCLKAPLSDRDTSGRSQTYAGSQNSGSTPCQSVEKIVRFMHVRITEFERVIGDNPSCSNGAPISLGWARGEEKSLPVDEYEAVRPNRRGHEELILNRQQRESLALEWGATFNEIIEAIRANVRAKNQRRRTVNSIGTYDRWEEVMENASRRIKRTLLMQKTTRLEPEEPGPKVVGKPEVQSEIENPRECAEVSRSVEDVERAEQVRPCVEIVESAKEDSKGGIEDEDEVELEQHIIPDTHDEADATEGSVSSRRPTRIIEIPVGQQSPVNSIVSEYTSYDFAYEYGALDQYGASGHYSDGFENLQRDNSFWELEEGRDAPIIRRKMSPIEISEDGPFVESELSHWNNGFLVQPPPFSNSIVSRWE